MSRGITLERVVQFFRENDLDVAEITLMHVSNIVGNRRTAQLGDARSQGDAARRTIKPRQSRKGKSLSTALQAGTIASSANSETLADA